MLRLAITIGDRIRHVPLPSASAMNIGSASDNEIVVIAPGVSRHHARIERTGRSVAIIDVGSKNGVRLGEERIQNAVLTPGQCVRLGAAALKLEEISTSDIDLAIRLSDESSTQKLDRVLDTDSLHSITEGPSGAVHWMRRIEEFSPHQQLLDAPVLLEDARRITGAETLVLFEPRGDEIDIAAIAGALPDECEATALATGKNNTEWSLLGATTGQLRLGVKGKGLRSAWRREFLDYVRAKLGDALGNAADTACHERPPAIVLPARMVPGCSAAMRKLTGDIGMIAHEDVDVLIVGETGTGKELVASAIHQNSARASAPFIAVNCAEIPASQAEAELFGIERGAATGVEARRGLLVAADRGTLLLDEIGEMPETLQPVLLRVLQEREVRPVGSASSRRIDIRVLASTNRSLEQLVSEGRFRADLYYRLRQSLVQVPALKERREDIPQLASALIQRAASSSRKRIAGISRKALERLVEYEWPGNVREMQHLLREAVLRCRHGGVIESEHLTLPASPRATTVVKPATSTTAATLQDRLDSAERAAILDALHRAGGNRSRAARLLGITRQGLYGKMKRYAID